MRKTKHQYLCSFNNVMSNIIQYSDFANRFYHNITRVKVYLKTLQQDLQKPHLRLELT